MVKATKTASKPRNFALFIKRIGKSVGNDVSLRKETSAEVDKMVRFVTSEVIKNCNSIINLYNKQGRSTLRPKTIDAALQLALRGNLRETACGAGKRRLEAHVNKAASPEKKSKSKKQKS